MANKIRTGQCVSYGPRFFFLFRFFLLLFFFFFFCSSVCTWQVKRVWFWTTAGAVRTPPHRRQPLRFALAVRLLYFFIFFNFFLLISVLFFVFLFQTFFPSARPRSPLLIFHLCAHRFHLTLYRAFVFFCFFFVFFRFFLAYSFHSFAYTPLLVFLFDFIGQSSVSDTPFDWMERGTPPQKRIKNQFKKNNRKKVTGGWPELRKRSFAEYFDFENKSGIVLFGPGKTSLDVGGTNRLTSLQKKYEWSQMIPFDIRRHHRRPNLPFCFRWWDARNKRVLFPTAKVSTKIRP